MVKKEPRRMNPVAKALTRRAGNAAVAVAADTRHRVERPKAGAGSYTRRGRERDMAAAERDAG